MQKFLSVLILGFLFSGVAAADCPQCGGTRDGGGAPTFEGTLRAEEFYGEKMLTTIENTLLADGYVPTPKPFTVDWDGSDFAATFWYSAGAGSFDVVGVVMKGHRSDARGAEVQSLHVLRQAP